VESPFSIAVVGLSGRFPGAADVDAFWSNVAAGIESILPVEDQALVRAQVPAHVASDPRYVKVSGAICGVELFDAAFFGYSPREAQWLDPQLRLLLECGREALESAGYVPETDGGRIGVFVGAASNLFGNGWDVLKQALLHMDPLQLIITRDKDFAAGHLSYRLNLRGPSTSLYTACSTSLVAISQACKSLVLRECELAIAGGAHIAVPRNCGYLYQEGGILSPDGHCRAFDAQAKGTVMGDGVGVVALKRLEEALADGDYIHAVIRGWAVNNDGSQKVGFTAPSIEGQANVILEALSVAGVSAETIGYVEAHGTGTELGDPIEVAALNEAFRGYTERRQFCALGSVKTNIGHLDAAAGVAGLIKTVQALKHRQLPPSLHFQQANPEIDFANSAFYVNTRLREWRSEGPRRAGVSSFGIGGTNAHVVLEEAPAREPSSGSREWKLVVLSAKSPASLEGQMQNLLKYAQEHPGVKLADAAYTLQVGRNAFEHRRALLVQAEELGRLSAQEGRIEGRHEGRRPLLGYMFPGQGTQYVGMTAGLYEQERTFRERIDECAQQLRGLLGMDLRSVLYAPEPAQESSAQLLKQTRITQPVLFTVEYALAGLWSSWGVKPDAMIGHSLGEYVAGCVAGVFSLSDALQVVARRGELMQSLPAGAMLSVLESEQSIRELLDERCSVAAVNGERACVISGPGGAIEELERRLRQQGVRTKRLQTSHAFHSSMMDPVVERFAEYLHTVPLKEPSIPFISNLTGTWIEAKQAQDPRYWAEQLRATVRFGAGLQQLREYQLLEVGPGRTLGALGRHSVGTKDRRIIASVREAAESRSDSEVMLSALGQLWASGQAIDWQGYYAHERRHRVPLPTYAFDRQRYWIEPPGGVAASGQQQTAAAVVGARADVQEWFYAPVWKQQVAAGGQERVSGLGQKWLLFMDEVGLGERLAQQLCERGCEVVRVWAGERFSRRAERAYSINPERSTDYAELLGELSRGAGLPRAMVHLWNVTAGEVAFDAAQRLGFYSLLYLGQALGAVQAGMSLRLSVISNQLHTVTGEERIEANKATSLGPCLVIPQEYPDILCSSLDVDLPGLSEQVLQQLVQDLLSESLEAVVAYRGRHRWVRRFDPIRLAKPAAGNTGLRARGVYLITGGLGGIGLAVAEHLARTQQAKLILTGLTGLPPPQEWEAWLAAHDEQERTSVRVRKVRELQQLGAEVIAAAVDVSDLSQMRQLVQQARQRFGRIHGVIHAAGLLDFAPMDAITPEHCEKHFYAKIRGMSVIRELFCSVHLDFCILNGSLSSILGGLGHAAYSAANAYLSALAEGWSPGEWRPQAISWDTWNLSPITSPDDSALSVQDAIDAFSRIVASPCADHIAVSQTDLTLRHAAWINPGRTASPALTARYARPALKTPFVDPVQQLDRQICVIWQEHLGIDRIGIQDNFFDLGGDSLMVVRVHAALRQISKKALSVKDIYRFPTVAQLSEYIAAEVGSHELDFAAAGRRAAARRVAVRTNSGRPSPGHRPETDGS
jgi:acyl transferase domain-containing protein/acyl carrier protein